MSGIAWQKLAAVSARETVKGLQIVSEQLARVIELLETELRSRVAVETVEISDVGDPEVVARLVAGFDDEARLRRTVDEEVRRDVIADHLHDLDNACGLNRLDGAQRDVEIVNAPTEREFAVEQELGHVSPSFDGPDAGRSVSPVVSSVGDAPGAGIPSPAAGATPGGSSMSPLALARAFARAVSLEIDHHAPLPFEVIFDLAHEFVDPDAHEAIMQVERLAEALAEMLESARALS